MNEKVMELTKEEIQFIADNITKFDIVRGIDINESCIDISGDFHRNGKETSFGCFGMRRKKFAM